MLSVSLHSPRYSISVSSYTTNQFSPCVCYNNETAQYTPLPLTDDDEDEDVCYNTKHANLPPSSPYKQASITPKSHSCSLSQSTTAEPLPSPSPSRSRSHSISTSHSSSESITFSDSFAIALENSSFLAPKPHPKRCANVLSPSKKRSTCTPFGCLSHRNNRRTSSPLSLVFSTTAAIQLIESECITPSSSLAGDDDDDDTEPAQEEVDGDDEQLLSSVDSSNTESDWDSDDCNKMIQCSVTLQAANSNTLPTLALSHSLLSSCSYSSTSITCSASSVLSDLCLAFPFCSKEEEINFDLSQKNHNAQIHNVDIAKTRRIAQDLFHKYHIEAWQKTQIKKGK